MQQQREHYEAQQAASHVGMMKFGAIALDLAAVGVMFVLPSQVFAYTGEKLAKGAKVRIDEARAIALKAQPGTISDEELEREKGGSGLRYSFRPVCLQSPARKAGS